jgi:lipoprotein-anchoring transpeptidase ErfK/SrfK
MLLWRGQRLVEREPVGIGRRAVTPTPAGLYYITELLRQSDPTGPFGPYAFGLSGHSNVLHEFAGGNGQIGIHGTNEPWAIGTDVSHGCIRVRNEVIRRLAALLPLGTPVQIAR